MLTSQYKATRVDKKESREEEKRCTINKIAAEMTDNSKNRKSFFWNSRGILKVKKRNKQIIRPPELPPVSWFYESGGISPIPVHMPNLSEVIVELNENEETVPDEFEASDDEKERKNTVDGFTPRLATLKNFEQRQFSSVMDEEIRKTHY